MTQPQRDCVIAGGGPAGMMLGCLLARAGLAVTVVEKHADFFRDFRGDTIHPSTITLLAELGLREKFLSLPVTRLSTLDAVIEGERMTLVDFGVLRPPENFLVFAPQWDFLDFLAQEARRLPGFELRMDTEVTGLLHEPSTQDGDPVSENSPVTGVRVRSASGEQQILARLTVAADGRDSALREAAGLETVESGVPIDVLWFSLPKPSDPPPATLGHLSSAGMVLTIDRGETYQCGLIIKKGAFPAMQQAGITRFRTRLVEAAPVLADVADTLTEWKQIKLLTVQINRLLRWHRPGFIAIGDAAHAITPQLRRGAIPERTLAAVQARRERPVKLMQAIQGRGHRVIARAVVGQRVLSPSAVLLLRLGSPVLRRITARVIGVGLLREHVRTPPADSQ